MSNEPEKEALKFHIELFEKTLTQARELEAEAPPQTFDDTLTLCFMLIARLLAAGPTLPVPVDTAWLLSIHIERCVLGIERYRAAKEAGLPTEPKLN